MLLRTPIDFGFAIRERRRQLGLDQEELAKRIGASRKWVIEVEKGKARAEIGLLLRALDVLGLRLSIGSEEAATAGSSAAITGVPVVDIDRILEADRDKRK
jgi:HTH-type transcriptional regulator/antitoxin HipB